jgi:hypothetical protein
LWTYFSGWYRGWWPEEDDSRETSVDLVGHLKDLRLFLRGKEATETKAMWQAGAVRI